MHTIIKGQEVEYASLDLGTNILLLNDGTRYTFDVIDLLYPFDAPNLRGNLIEVESLAFGNGKWMLGKESLGESLNNIEQSAHAQLNKARSKINKSPIPLRVFYEKLLESPQLYFQAQSEQEDDIIKQINSGFFKADYVRCWQLRDLLQKHDHNNSLKAEVCAVAWFEGNEVPLLLRKYALILPTESQVAIGAKLDALQVSIDKVARVKEIELQQTKKALGLAQETASMNLAQALTKWMHFDPPKMKTETTARIEKAVKTYMTDPDKRSLAKVAAAFNVSRQCVSQWFKSFTEHTGFKVVTHRKHESVASHLKAKRDEILPAKKK